MAMSTKIAAVTRIMAVSVYNVAIRRVYLTSKASVLRTVTYS